MEIEILSWRELTGNKFSKGLNTAMLEPDGYQALTRIRQIGSAERKLYNVVFDYDYALNYLICKVFRTLPELNRQKVLDLINEAYDLYEKPIRLTQTWRKS